MVRAVALEGFYRGDAVQKGELLDLPDWEFAELQSCGRVALAPPPPPINGRFSPEVTVTGKAAGTVKKAGGK